jgi:deoxyribodipyrimidine photolyase-related protein
MSDYCVSCRYDPAVRTGDEACPFTTFYWDFLLHNRGRFKDNRRMTLRMKNLQSIGSAEGRRVQQRAAQLHADPGVTKKKAAAA